jgi:hypothetical protein
MNVDLLCPFINKFTLYGRYKLKSTNVFNDESQKNKPDFFDQAYFL